VFESVDFTTGNAPTYHDYAPGRPLGGTVVTRSGRRLTGRLVYDLDESETTETLDVRSRGVDYTIPFERVASIDLLGDGGVEGARVLLQGGEKLDVERSGDVGATNAGLLVFSSGNERPVYVAWEDVARVEFDAR
jgi:hypothetical protein